MELKRNDPGCVEDGARPVDQGRRNAMRKIAVGMGVLATYSILPDQWTKPIIGQVVLPAHAATSGSTLNDPCSVVLTAGTQATGTVTILVTGFVTPPTANVPIAIVATATGGASLSVNATITTNAAGNYSAAMTIGGGPNITSVSVTSTATGADGVAHCGVTVPAVATTTTFGTLPPGTSTVVN